MLPLLTCKIHNLLKRTPPKGIHRAGIAASMDVSMQICVMKERNQVRNTYLQSVLLVGDMLPSWDIADHSHSRSDRPCRVCAKHKCTLGWQPPSSSARVFGFLEAAWPRR